MIGPIVFLRPLGLRLGRLIPAGTGFAYHQERRRRGQTDLEQFAELWNQPEGADSGAEDQPAEQQAAAP